MEEGVKNRDPGTTRTCGVITNTQLAAISLSLPPSWVSSFFLNNSRKELLFAPTSHQISRQGTREPWIILQNSKQKIKAPTSAQAGGAISIILQMKGSPLPSFRNKVGWDKKAGTHPFHPDTPDRKYMEMRVWIQQFPFIYTTSFTFSSNPKKANRNPWISAAMDTASWI